MSTNGASTSPGGNSPEQRRWLIGIGISIAFGLFGVVMALLSYTDRADRTKPSAPPAAAAPAAAAPAGAAPAADPAGPTSQGKGKRRGRD